MAGSIIQLEEGRKGRCRKWRLQVPAGRDPQTGKYRRIMETFHGSFSEAEARLAEINEEIRSNAVVDSSDMELRDFAARWLERERANKAVAPRTIEKYDDHIGALNLVLGYAKVQDLTPWDIEDAYAKMRAGASRSGAPLSGTYVSCCHSTLKTMLEEAVRRRLIRHNPCVDVKPPKVDTAEKASLSSGDLLSLIASMDPHNRNHVAVLLCCMMGLRRGEVVGLDWDDIDFRERVLYVRHSYDDLGNLKAPKTKASIRSIPMPDAVVDALVQLRVDQDRYPALFCDEFGNRMKPHSLSRWWARHRDEFGFPGITLHELRHSYISHLARQNVPVSTTQRIVGHSSPAVTLAIYTHTDMDDKRRAISQAF